MVCNCFENLWGPWILGFYGRSRSTSPGSGSRIRKYSPRRWFSRKSLDEPVQIKVYEVEDMEKIKKAMEPNFQVKKKRKYCWTVSEGVSFEWSHHRISCTDSNVRTTLYSIINSTTGKYCSVAFIWIRSHHRICVKSPKLKLLSVILEEKSFTWKCSKWLIFKSRISKYYQICLNLSLIVIFVSIIQWQDSEKRQSRIASLRQRQRNLKDEFSEAKQRLLDENQRWSYGRKFWNVSYAYHL